MPKILHYTIMYTTIKMNNENGEKNDSNKYDIK